VRIGEIQRLGRISIFRACLALWGIYGLQQKKVGKGEKGFYKASYKKTGFYNKK